MDIGFVKVCFYLLETMNAFRGGCGLGFEVTRVGGLGVGLEVGGGGLKMNGVAGTKKKDVVCRWVLGVEEHEDSRANIGLGRTLASGWK